MYDDHDAVGLAQAVRRREVSPSELLEEAIGRAERANARVNALTARGYDRAREHAAGTFEGPFAGVPFVAKDLGPPLAGMPMTMGSRYFSAYTPAADHEFFRRVRAAGLNIFAKSSTPEFGLLPYTEPALFGPCRNPWDLERTPGGSSGGSAALVASGVLPMAHGNDMGGSIRIPAACTGLFGLKPSRGRTPTTGGVIGEANVDHAVSRTVRDSAALLDALRSDDGPRFSDAIAREPGRLRIAVVRGAMLGHGIVSEVEAALDDTVDLCRSLGHDVVDDEPVGIDYAAMSYALLLLFAAQIGWHLGAGNPTPAKPLRSGDLEPATRAMLAIARTLPMDELTSAVVRQRALTATFAEFMQRYDVVLTPTLAAPPVRIGELALSSSEKVQIEVLTALRPAPLIRKAARDISARMFDWLPYTPVFNLTGQPAVSVPLAWTHDGLPLGLQFAGRMNDEATLFSLAAQLERAKPWRDRRPPFWSGFETPSI
jgi:Asp-tRNA(Asn)/Glu-tRNA(Gln) amidotransferase A subunit family amidase